jgi:hypothetical protein
MEGKQNMKNQTIKIRKSAAGDFAAQLKKRVTTSAVAFGLCLAMTAGAQSPAPPQPPNCNMKGKTLAQWQALYWDWFAGDIALKTDSNGNAISSGVVLMAFPITPGDGTPGSISITLNAGEPFVLPFFMLAGNSYTNGAPSDTMVSANDFQDPNFKVTLDGVAIITGTTVPQFYTQTVFNPPLPCDNCGVANEWIWVQGITMVHAPLPVGNHVITMDEKFIIPEYALTFEFHNTWQITVKAAN